MLPPQTAKCNWARFGPGLVYHLAQIRQTGLGRSLSFQRPNAGTGWNYGSGTDLGQNWPRTVTIAMTCGADLAQIRESYFTSGAHLALVCDPYLGLIRPWSVI